MANKKGVQTGNRQFLKGSHLKRFTKSLPEISAPGLGIDHDDRHDTMYGHSTHETGRVVPTKSAYTPIDLK